MINKPSPLNRDYNRDPNIEALKKRGVINHGSTLEGLGFRVQDKAAQGQQIKG